MPTTFKLVAPNSVKVPVAAVELPMTELLINTPSIVPPLISAVVTIPISVHVEPAAVGDPLIVGSIIVDVASVLLFKVCVAPKPATTSEAPGKVNVVSSVPAKVNELLACKVLLSAIVNVPPFEDVIVSPL